MTTIDTAIVTAAAPRKALVQRVTNAMADFLRAWKNRREIYRLGELSDHQLADIGLTRGDLHVAWRTPISEDPTATLGTLAGARLAAEDAARRVC